MKQKRVSLIVFAVALAAITLLISSSTARTHATTSQGSTADDLMGNLSAMNATLEAGSSPFHLDRGEYLT
jgi:hypothetical protein